MKIIFSLFFFLVASHAEKARFDNYRVYEVSIENSDQLKALRQLADTSDSVNFLMKFNDFFKFIENLFTVQFRTLSKQNRS
jgi:hypothetical protein